MTDRDPMRVDCTECPFTRIVHNDEDELPADVVRQHGRETGHVLELVSVEEDGDRLSV